MSEDKVLELAAKAQLVSMINGKADAYYAPPAAIKLFAKLLLEEYEKQNANA